MATASNQPIPDVVHNDRVGVSVRIVNKDYSDEMEHTSHRIASPQLWPLTDNIKFTKVINDRLLHSVLTVSDTTREAGADRIYKFLENKPMGDYTFRTDIGYLK
jgi:hypothetical protein